MPIYIVRCDNCNTEVEVRCKYEDLKEMICPDCKSPVHSIPCASGFKINGHSFANGYNETKQLDYNYQGYDSEWKS